MNRLKLVARDFECYPNDSLACQQLAPLVSQLGDVSYFLTIREKNSNQIDSDFDSKLEQKLLQIGAVRDGLKVIDGIEKQFDFVFSIKDERVVVEVEKTNREKILYDLLKCHMYLNSGADYALLFLPKNYAHSSGEWNLFETGRGRYQQCLKYDFGLTFYFKRILLVGFKQIMVDGRPLTKGVRKELIAQNKAIRLRTDG